MKALIVSATLEEIKDSLPFLEKNKIPYLITGVGMVATTYALTKYLSLNHSFDVIINVGIAGAFDKKLDLGDLVEIDNDIFSELGAEDADKFINISELGFGQQEFQNIKYPALNTNLPKLTGITVNTIHGDEQSINRVKSLFPNAGIESMEGAAIFYVASQFQTASIQVRSISNYVEKRDKSTWKIGLAINNLNNWLQSFLQQAY